MSWCLAWRRAEPRDIRAGVPSDMAGGYAPTLDGVLPALYLAVIVWQGQRLAGHKGCQLSGKE